MSLARPRHLTCQFFPISHATEKMQINYILGNATFDMKQTNLIHSIFSLNCKIANTPQDSNYLKLLLYLFAY